MAWALVVGSLRTDLPIPVYPIVALFSAIWAIYLFDRLYDTKGLVIDKTTPQRHRFTAKFRTLLIGLLFVAVGVAAGSFPFLPSAVVWGGSVIAAATAAYYIVFRFFRRLLPRLATGPWKELTIAACFTAGIFLSVPPLRATANGMLLAAALTSLFLANCLRISLAEADYDRDHDPAGFFSSSRHRSSKAVILLPLFALLIAIYLILQNDVSPVGISVLSTSVICLLINRSQKIPRHLVQAFADLSLLIPPLVVLGIQFILTR